jgi:hypothetical protein
MAVTQKRAVRVQHWAGRLLAIAGALLLLEVASGIYSAGLSELPFSWVLTPIPFGIGFVLIPLMLLWSYQYLAGRTPTSALVGIAFVAALPVGTIILVGWGVLGLASGLVPELTVLPVRVDTVFSALLVLFALGITTFGLNFLQNEQTRLLGGSLLTFVLGWAIPLAVAKLWGVYPEWLSNVGIVSVAIAMIAIGYCFPPSNVSVDSDLPIV